MRYRIDRREPIADDQIAYYTDWMGGPTLAGIGNCRIAGLPLGTRYSVRVTGEPGTYFSIPAETTIKGRRIVGSLSALADFDGDKPAYIFHPHRQGRGRMWRALLPKHERLLLLHDVSRGWYNGAGSRGYRLLCRVQRWLRSHAIALDVPTTHPDGRRLTTAEVLTSRDPLCAAFAEYLIATFTVRDDARTLGSVRRYQRRAAF
jgi:hypothetical protein